MNILIILLFFSSSNIYGFTNKLLKSKNVDKECWTQNAISSGIKKSFNYGKTFSLCNNFLCPDGYDKLNDECLLILPLANYVKLTRSGGVIRWTINNSISQTKGVILECC